MEHAPQSKDLTTVKHLTGAAHVSKLIEPIKAKIREFYLREMIYLSHASNPKTVCKEIDDCGGADNYINVKNEEWINKYEKIKEDISEYGSDNDDFDDKNDSIMKNNLLLVPETFGFSDIKFKDYQYYAFNRLKKLLREIED